MSWLSDLFGGEESRAGTVDTLTAAERATMDKLAGWLEDYIGKGAAAYPGQLTADIPELFTQAYEKYAAGFEGDLGTATDAAIRDMIAGKPAYTFDPEATAERWEETYAGPVMEAYREHVLPGIKEGFNIPGVMYSRGAGRGVGRAAGEFYGEHVAPTLYSSLQTGERMGFESVEAAAARQPGALGLPAMQFAQEAGVAGAMQQQLQAALSATYNEFLRTRAEPGWAAETALQVKPTLSPYVTQGYNPLGDILQSAIGAYSLLSPGKTAPTQATPAQYSGAYGYSGGLTGYSGYGF